MLELDREQVLAYRLRMNHLAGRLPARSHLATAALSGLQDSAPRSALLSLAARVDGVRPDDWQAPGLAQVFGPRGAIYVVAEPDVPVFTLGLLPRDPERIARLETVAAQAHYVLGGRAMRQRDLDAALPEVGGNRELRWAACLGTLVPVWDAVDTIVHPTAKPDMEAESARLELARRFFRYLGPATIDDYRWWIAAESGDARATIVALGDELTPVLASGIEKLALTATLSHLADNGERIDPELVHLLPPDDTYINRRTRDALLPDLRRRRLLWPQAPPPGALVISGEVAGTWRRRGRAVAIETWAPIAKRHMKRAEEVASRWPLSDTEVTVTWRSLR